MATTGGLKVRGERYSRVAIVLHWTIAALILWNLVSGFLIWDLAKDWFHEHRPFYAMGLVSHLSSGLTVLVLTVLRIVWRLTHEPPPYPASMKTWERHTSHIVHFLLYAAMVLMPLSGWSILSAHAPAGSPGEAVERAMMPAPPPPPPATPGTSPAGAPPKGMMGPPRVWWVLMPMPVIQPLAEIGREPGGVKPLVALHDKFVEWHELGAWLTVLVLLLHIAGALKHQWIDREDSLSRMGLGKGRRDP